MDLLNAKDDLDFSFLKEKFTFVKQYKSIMLRALDDLIGIVSVLHECKDQYPHRLEDFSKFDPVYGFMAEVMCLFDSYDISLSLPEVWEADIPEEE